MMSKFKKVDLFVIKEIMQLNAPYKNIFFEIMIQFNGISKNPKNALYHFLAFQKKFSVVQMHSSLIWYLVPDNKRHNIIDFNSRE